MINNHPTSQAVPVHNNVGLEELNKTDRLLVQQVCLWRSYSILWKIILIMKSLTARRILWSSVLLWRLRGGEPIRSHRQVFSLNKVLQIFVHFPPNFQRDHTLCCTLLVQRACALRALGLLLGDSALTVGRGKTFWAVGKVFLRKRPYLGNKRSTNRYQDGKWTVSPKATNWPLTKIGVLRQKSGFRAQKKAHFLLDTMFWPWPEKVVQRRKYPFFKIHINLLRNFGCLLG